MRIVEEEGVGGWWWWRRRFAECGRKAKVLPRDAESRCGCGCQHEPMWRCQVTERRWRAEGTIVHIDGEMES